MRVPKFISTKRTVQLLRDEELNEKDKLIYFIIYSIFVAIFINYSAIDKDHGINFTLDLTFSLISAIIGNIILFRVNRNVDNKNFIERIVILGIPIGFKVISIFIAIIILATVGLIIYDEINQTNYLDTIYDSFYFGLVSNTCLYTYYYLLNIKALKKLKMSLRE